MTKEERCGILETMHEAALNEGQLMLLAYMLSDDNEDNFNEFILFLRGLDRIRLQNIANMN